jgi:GNAT superfamily N-acetyltransferase
MPSSPPLEADVATLRDGSRVVIRPLEGADRRALSAAFERLGEESRYRRFLCATPRLTESQLSYLTEVDQHDHVALAAVDATFGSGIVGVARFVRLGGPEAEPAIAVVDDCQGRGLGTALIAALVDRSREQGVTRYRATALAHNVPVLRLLGAIGTLRSSAAGATLLVTVDLPDVPVDARRMS